MTLPMPTVDQLVQVFRERNWTPTTGAGGCVPDNVVAGRCCAVPALLAIAGEPLDEFEEPQDLYDRARELYGEVAADVYLGFDATNEHDFARRTGNLSPHRAPWAKLGRDLAKALGLHAPVQEEA